VFDGVAGVGGGSGGGGARLVEDGLRNQSEIKQGIAPDKMGVFSADIDC
jgi:hypothetical protein